MRRVRHFSFLGGNMIKAILNLLHKHQERRRQRYIAYLRHLDDLDDEWCNQAYRCLFNNF